ncbi:MAG TPA: outer membrane beta-barrel protein [Myxococcota bacterium]|nr:outer membrane beta-barrel protein [Myxococcota bacterium]HRY93704.1 outer membrane beta-barrel protein [Myxococcota bacterium]
MASKSCDRAGGWWVALLLAGLAVAWAGQARALEPANGFAAELLIGTDFCVEHAGVDCDHISPSFAFAPTLAYRLRDYYALFLTFHFGMFEVPRDSQVFDYGVLAGGRIYIPLGLVEPFIQAGIGWSKTEEENEEQSFSSDGFQIAGGLGVQFRLTDVLSVGVSFTYHLPQHGRLCYDSGSIDGCRDASEDFEHAHTVMLGVNVTGWLENLTDPVEPDLRVPVTW